MVDRFGLVNIDEYLLLVTQAGEQVVLYQGLTNYKRHLYKPQCYFFSHAILKVCLNYMDFPATWFLWRPNQLLLCIREKYSPVLPWMFRYV